MKMFRLCLVLGLPLILASKIWAQPDSNFIEKIQQMKKKKLLEKLELPKEKTEAFLAVYDRYSDDERQLMRDKQALFRRLVHMTALGGDVADEKINQTIDQINELERKIIGRHEAVLEQLRGTLTASQTARFIVFEQNFQFRLRQMWNDVQRRKNRMKKFLGPMDDEDSD
jgi:hypothetical protein